jgi:hypothetical protein
MELISNPHPGQLTLLVFVVKALTPLLFTKSIPVDNADFVAQNTPTLHNILTRAAKKISSSKSAKGKSPLEEIVLNKTLEYRPSSISSFLSRLSTFKLSTYSNKPAPIDAVAAAKCGWVNEGKDRLVCTICSVSWVLAGREGMSMDAGKKRSYCMCG